MGDMGDMAEAGRRNSKSTRDQLNAKELGVNLAVLREWSIGNATKNLGMERSKQV